MAANLPLPTGIPESARIYLRPVGLVGGGLAGGSAAASMIAAGIGRPLAGGPIAFTACEIAIRVDGRISRAAAAVGALEDWARRLGGVAEERVGILLRRLAAPRADPIGGDLARPRLMGIINATPDSFSDGGRFLDPAVAVAHGLALAEAGAGILDIGGESTRPGAEPVSAEVEIARVRPVLEGLAAARNRLGDVAISIDTRRAAVMRTAIAAGADIINDITALMGDAESQTVAAGSKAAVVLMHMQGEPATMNRSPSYEDVALDVFDALETRVDACIAAGIARRRLIVDPGIGFGKRSRENLAILGSLSLFHGLGVPLLLGVSRKGLGGVAGEETPPEQRLPASLGAAMHALGQGVQILRVHDVAETRQVAALWERLNEAGE